MEALRSKILSLCESRGLAVAENAAIGPYIAPVSILAYDSAGLARDVRIVIELRNWNRPVAGRMQVWARSFRERLRSLTGADFVAILIDGDEAAPDGITSVGELATFLDGFGPPARRARRFRGYPAATRKYETEIAGKSKGWTGSGVVFCAMPFAPQFDGVFFDLIAPAVEDAGLTVLRTDHADTLESILNRIQEGIRMSDLVLADLTGHNVNVMYEVGFAHASGKQTLLLRSDALPTPFDILYHELIEYAREDCANVRQVLAQRLKQGFDALWRV